MKAVGVGLLIEEQRSDIAACWRRSLERELGGEPALAFAVGPLLREMGLALRDGRPAAARPESGTLRSAVLVRSGASPARIAREFKLLHRALWETLRAAGRVVGADERRAADEWLDEALAASLERLDRVRTRVDLLEQAVVPPKPVLQRATQAERAQAERTASPRRPPPLPAARARETPPPLPASAGAGVNYH